MELELRELAGDRKVRLDWRGKGYALSMDSSMCWSLLEVAKPGTHIRLSLKMVTLILRMYGKRKRPAERGSGYPNSPKEKKTFILRQWQWWLIKKKRIWQKFWNEQDLMTECMRKEWENRKRKGKCSVLIVIRAVLSSAEQTSSYTTPGIGELRAPTFPPTFLSPVLKSTNVPAASSYFVLPHCFPLDCIFFKFNVDNSSISNLAFISLLS